LSKRGLDNIGVLNKFVNDCVVIYHKEERDKDDIQKIFEYQLSKTDDEGIQTLSFQESVFQSNKTFANLFFENKEKVLKEIQKFSRNLSEKEKNEIKEEYKYQGMPFKSIYLLYGPPGVGKSSLIKAFMNETKRHGMTIPWSRIKTAADFTNICRVNHKNLSQKDVILIFEDFDANSSTVVKTRKNLKPQEKEKTEEKNEGSETVIKNTIDTLMKITTLPDKEKEDELTLECVLNTLDGINELHDAVIVFTTNDIISIDPALLRSGRIDKIIHMDYIKTPIIKEMIEYSFKTKVEEILPDMKISPAIVQEICKRCKTDIHKCIAELIQQGCPLNNIPT
jgi:SpoVK/Ycf46/Vps4 family AAA+-type ATPase